MSFSDYLGRVILVLLVIAGVYLAVRFNYRHGIARVVRYAPPALSATLPAYDASFSTIGTVIYYPSNGPHIEYPWLVYRDTRGNVATKALLTSAAPPAGSMVRVSGLLEDEHVRVASLTILQ